MWCRVDIVLILCAVILPLRDGDVFTKNMKFEGPVAQVSIDGRIGLKNKD